MYKCPVCFYDKMETPARDYNICVCCGTEFGNDDCDHSYEELRESWIAQGAKWFFREPPLGWNRWSQLSKGCEENPVTVSATYTVTAPMRPGFRTLHFDGVCAFAGW
jgi:hypothetical protein